VVAASGRLVLTPIGNGNWEHIGDKVPLPEPIPLKQGVYEVGRAAPADIVLRIPTVSTRHALLRVENDTISITDLNSTNGTVVNGQELTAMDTAEISAGSEIIFGDMYLAKFQVDKLSDDEDDGHALGQDFALYQQQQQQQGTQQTHQNVHYTPPPPLPPLDWLQPSPPDWLQPQKQQQGPEKQFSW